MSGAPELSNVAVERTGVGSARLSFDSSQKARYGIRFQNHVLRTGAA